MRLCNHMKNRFVLVSQERRSFTFNLWPLSLCISASHFQGIVTSESSPELHKEAAVGFYTWADWEVCDLRYKEMSCKAHVTRAVQLLYWNFEINDFCSISHRKLQVRGHLPEQALSSRLCLLRLNSAAHFFTLPLSCHHVLMDLNWR